MTYFLTSSTCVAGAPILNPANGFVDELKKALPSPCPALFVCSSPDEPERTERFAASVAESFAAAGIALSALKILDRRTQSDAAVLVAEARLIILAGGHVPTQNRFFNEIGLRDLMRSFPGVVLGISAGTMNSADTVYAQPELEGEAVSADYEKFLPGLGLTRTMVIPHYQMIKDYRVDGLRLFEDVTYPDSMGRCFYALVDGSYLYGRDGVEELRGEAYRIRDGVLEQISSEGEVLHLARTK
ncbi:MAG: Type 1 glutamine amidotransferase-like domain-containing protein [Oscillospiraceae bacterium]